MVEIGGVTPNCLCSFPDGWYGIIDDATGSAMVSLCSLEREFSELTTGFTMKSTGNRVRARGARQQGGQRGEREGAKGAEGSESAETATIKNLETVNR